MRPVPKRALDLIKRFEGLRLKAYQCPAEVWTIGWGHTGLVHNDGTVFEGRLITRAEAAALLEHDLAVFSSGVDAAVKVALNDNQFGALVSLAFNIGMTNFRGSTLLKRLNQGDLVGAAEQFQVWRLAKGKVLPGLVKRRAAEAHLFLSHTRGMRREPMAQAVTPDPDFSFIPGSTELAINYRV